MILLIFSAICLFSIFLLEKLQLNQNFSANFYQNMMTTFEFLLEVSLCNTSNRTWSSAGTLQRVHT